MARIDFAGDKPMSVEVPDGTPLQQAIDQHGADIMFGCREGNCATCMIDVLSGPENLSPPTDAEETTLMPDELERNIRLACQCRVQGGAVTIRRSEEGL